MYFNSGSISFVLRRFTGVVLSLYLFMHMWVIGSAIQGRDTFNERMGMIQTPVTMILEILLLAAVVYHSFDGVRLLIVHYFKVTEYRRSLFYAAFAISVILTVAGGLPILLYALGVA